MSRQDITQKMLLDLLDYDPSTGVVRWRISPSKKVKVGAIITAKQSKGYITIGIDGKRYLLHRVIWKYVTGNWPKLDHKNLNKTDNSWKNLRDATGSQNQANHGLQKNNTSGFKGVSWSRKYHKWVSSIKCNGRYEFLGHYDDIEIAKEAYATAADRLFGEFARAA